MVGVKAKILGDQDSRDRVYHGPGFKKRRSDSGESRRAPSQSPDSALKPQISKSAVHLGTSVSEFDGIPDLEREADRRKISRRAKEDRDALIASCARLAKEMSSDFYAETRGDLGVNYLGQVCVNSPWLRERYPSVRRDSSGHPVVTAGDFFLDVDYIIDSIEPHMDFQRPYLVVGFLPTGSVMPKETLVRIKSPSRLFKELRKAARGLRPWYIRLLSLKSETGFALYECTTQGYHQRIQVDESSHSLLAEMFGEYNTPQQSLLWLGKRYNRDAYGKWLTLVHKELNDSDADPRLGKYSLQILLNWSAFKLAVWGSIPILLSLIIGFWYTYKHHEGEDYVAIVQTAWGIASYIVTAGARKYHS